MPLELVAFNPPRKKRRKAKAHRRGRKHHKHHEKRESVNPPTKRRRRRHTTQGTATMAKHHRRKRIASNPPHPHHKHHHGRKSKGGGRGTSIKSLLSANGLMSGAMIGGAVVGSQIGADLVLRKFLPDKANNIYIVTATQLGLGVVGAMLLGKMGHGLGKYAEAWMTGSTASAAVNLYGYFRSQQVAQANQQNLVAGPAPIAGMLGLAGGRFTKNGAANFAAA